MIRVTSAQDPDLSEFSWAIFRKVCSASWKPIFIAWI